MGDLTRDDWAAIPLALNALANAIMAPYPTHGVTQFVGDQYKIAQQNAVEMKRQEEARQAAKRAHRAQNRNLVGAAVGTVAGAGLGAAKGMPMGQAMQMAGAGGQMGGSLASGNYAGLSDAMLSMGKSMTPVSSSNAGADFGGKLMLSNSWEDYMQ